MTSLKRPRPSTTQSEKRLPNEAGTTVGSLSKGRRPVSTSREANESMSNVDYTVDDSDESPGPSDQQLKSTQSALSFRPVEIAEKASGRGHYTYRQPPLRLIPDIQESAIWQEGRVKFDRMASHPDTAPATVVAARSLFKQLGLSDRHWALVEEAERSGTDGRCASCIKKDLDCIVRWAPNVNTIDPSATDIALAPQLVISRCLSCIIGRTARCDLVIRPGNQMTKPQAISSAPIAGPVPTQKTQASTPKPIPKPHPKAIKSRRGTELPGQLAAPPARVEALKSSSIESDEDVDIKDVVAAVEDMSEFANTMREMLADRMDFKTRGMFAMVDAHMELISKYVKRHLQE